MGFGKLYNTFVTVCFVYNYTAFTYILQHHRCFWKLVWTSWQGSLKWGACGGTYNGAVVHQKQEGQWLALIWKAGYEETLVDLSRLYINTLRFHLRWATLQFGCRATFVDVKMVQQQRIRGCNASVPCLVAGSGRSAWRGQLLVSGRVVPASTAKPGGRRTVLYWESEWSH